MFKKATTSTARTSTSLPKGALRHLKELAETNNTIREVVIEMRDILRDPARQAEYGIERKDGTTTSSQSPTLVDTASSPRSSSIAVDGTVGGWIDVKTLIGQGLVDEVGRDNRYAEKQRRRSRARTNRLYKSKVERQLNRQALDRTKHTFFAVSHYEKFYAQQLTLQAPWQATLTFVRGRAPEPDLDDMLLELFACSFDETLFEKRYFDSDWNTPPDELEYSYGLTFEVILNRFLCVLECFSSNPERVLPFQHLFQANWNDFRKYAPIFVEAGRFFNELTKSINTRGSTEGCRAQFTFISFLQRCEERGLKQHLEFSTHLPFLDIDRRTVSPEEIAWSALAGMSRIDHLHLDPPCRSQYNLFILDLYEQVCGYDQGDDKDNESPNRVSEAVHFETLGLSFKSLKEIGGLTLIWTNRFVDHLRLSVKNKTLSLFWDANLIWRLYYWPRLPPYELSLYGERRGYFDELQKTYTIIFNNPQATGDREFIRQRILKGLQDDSGIQLSEHSTRRPGGYTKVEDPTRPVRIDIHRPQVQRILKHYLDCSPPDILSQKLTASPTGDMTQLRDKPITIGDILRMKRPLPQDIWIHIDSLLQPPPDGTQSFSDYRYFGSQLQELQKYMDNQQPRSLPKLWKDRRNTVGYVTLWAVIVMGAVTTVLALVGIAVSSAQTVAAFESLKAGASS